MNEYERVTLKDKRCFFLQVTQETKNVLVGREVNKEGDEAHGPERILYWGVLVSVQEIGSRHGYLIIESSFLERIPA